MEESDVPLAPGMFARVLFYSKGTTTTTTTTRLLYIFINMYIFHVDS